MKIPLLWKVRYRRLLERMASWFRPRKLEALEAWAARDALLLDQWFAALERQNREECERLQELMNTNWCEYQEAS